MNYQEIVQALIRLQTEDDSWKQFTLDGYEYATYQDNVSLTLKQKAGSSIIQIMYNGGLIDAINETELENMIEKSN